jgi:Arc/MetJ-type ribon-helix-helix transcriptional regulator
MNNMVRKCGYVSSSDVSKEALGRLATKRSLRWRNRKEVYEYFSHKKKILRGLEKLHEEEDI